MTLRIGWSQRDITPNRPVLLAGQNYSRVSEGVQNPVTATALALEGDGAQAIWVACDLVSVREDVIARVREAVARRIPDFNARDLILSATHTHTAPELRVGRYPEAGGDALSVAETADFFAARAAEAAAAAWAARAPGGVSRAHSHAVVGHNRRSVFRDGSAKMYAFGGSAFRQVGDDFDGFEGYVDHGVDLLFTWNEARELTGLIVNLACPSQVTEHLREISADYWHETRRALRERYGEGLFILPQCAPAGDLSPHVQINKRLEEEEMLSRLGRTQREEIALRIGAAVDWVFDAARAEIDFAPRFVHCAETVALPRRMVTDKEAEAARAGIETLEQDEKMPSDQKHCRLRRNREVMRRYKEQDARPDLPADLHVLRLGDAVLATNPFELFLDYGMRIKARSPAAQAVLVQLAGGSQGYLPTRRATESRLHAADRGKHGFLGNYSAGVASTPVGPEGGDALVEATVARIDAIWAERDAPVAAGGAEKR
ncbi:MAG: hypothetical protein ACOC95_00755 [Planctomycetota bacterium]